MRWLNNRKRSRAITRSDALLKSHARIPEARPPTDRITSILYNTSAWTVLHWRHPKAHVRDTLKVNEQMHLQEHMRLSWRKLQRTIDLVLCRRITAEFAEVDAVVDQLARQLGHGDACQRPQQQEY